MVGWDRWQIGSRTEDVHPDQGFIQAMRTCSGAGVLGYSPQAGASLGSSMPELLGTARSGSLVEQVPTIQRTQVH